MEAVTARTYRRDPKGTSTGGQFTESPATSNRGPLTYQGTYKRPSGGGGGGSTLVTAPAGTMQRGGDNPPLAVAQLQALLTELGLGDISEDGFGEATEAAVKAAQAKLGVKKPTGRATPALVRALRDAHKLSPCIDRSASKVTAALDDDLNELDESEDDDGEPVTAAAGKDVTPGHDELHHYWVAGPGLARWAGSPTPWTTLLANLVEEVKDKPLETLKKWASAWFIEHFHFAAGSDLNRVTHGHPPRGKVVGPG